VQRVLSSRYLDTFLNPHRISIHRAVLMRLVPLWLGLSLVFGGGAYWLATQRVDAFVLDLATQAVTRIEQTTPPALFAAPPAELAAKLGSLLRPTQFVGVRLFSADKRLLIESWREHDPELPGATATRLAPFPLPGIHHRIALRLNGHIYVHSLVPLTDSGGKVYGYFEGVYLVAPSMAKAIGTSIGDTLAGVLIVVTLSSLALYPVIVTLNRDTTRLSHNLLASNVELMRVLGSAIAKRDSDTDSHNFRVTLYALAIAEALGHPISEIISLMAGAFLHDVGKIGITDTILLKPGSLTPEEFTVMKTHVEIGLQIIGEVQWLEIARDVVGCHHERFDGSGYPHGLKDGQIPFNARLFAIVDVFDALTSKRPYKEAFSFERSMELMRTEYARLFDPQIFRSFEGIAAELYQRYNQAETPVLRQRLAESLEKYFWRSNPEHPM
jgi:HD-GYP domain-containing protein (c-di-GMP phosphodiesterase class II)